MEPTWLCLVSYATIDDSIKQIIKLGGKGLLAKTDIASAVGILYVSFHPHDNV